MRIKGSELLEKTNFLRQSQGMSRRGRRQYFEIVSDKSAGVGVA